MTMMRLGPYRFSVSSAAYEKYSETTSWRWSKVDRIGRMPALQFLGPDTPTITLSGTVYPHFKGGLRQVELMKAIAGFGQPMLLVDGKGWIWGMWVITRITEDRSVFHANGSPRQIDFSLQLEKYGTSFSWLF